MFSRDQGLMPNSVLTWIALAYYVITRPGLSSQGKVFTLPNDEGKEVPYMRIVCNKLFTTLRSTDVN